MIITCPNCSSRDLIMEPPSWNRDYFKGVVKKDHDAVDVDSFCLKCSTSFITTCELKKGETHDIELNTKYPFSA